LSLVMNIIIRALYYISLFLFTHRTLNKLLHLDDTSVSLATMLGEVCGTSWLTLLGLVILPTNFLVFYDAHFVYLVLIHVSLHSCTVTDSSSPSVTH